MYDPGLMQPEHLSLWQVTDDPRLLRRHSNTQRQVWLSLCQVSGSWCTQSLVWALWVSLVSVRFDSKHGFAPYCYVRTFSFSWMWGIFFWWDPTFSCWWFFRSKLLFWNSQRRIWVQVLLFKHLVTKIFSFHSSTNRRQSQRMFKLQHNCTHLTC